MDLYFSPLACSMATRVALYEAGAEANYLEVDSPTKKVLKDGSDFRTVNPIGLVPTLRTDEGVVLTENAAILQYVADRFPQSGIGATAGIDRTRLHQWLCFIGTELHKGLFVRSASSSRLTPRARTCPSCRSPRPATWPGARACWCCAASRRCRARGWWSTPRPGATS